eukprot:TRINITY_DN11140_c0_g1_i1.p1 TRINITY_DN11140_c0_g1~~TRINITY_DN11140_c0_g1_i1.p1  ORF type:complete len:353 (-),score=41.96 TRINITY_DN11140_c0_g1_i1:54-1112(-)
MITNNLYLIFILFLFFHSVDLNTKNIYSIIDNNRDSLKYELGEPINIKNLLSDLNYNCGNPGVGQTFDIVKQKCYDSVIEFTYNQGKELYYSPNDKNYIFPDQVYVNPKPFSEHQLGIHAVGNFSAYTDNYLDKTDLSISYSMEHGLLNVKGAFSKIQKQFDIWFEGDLNLIGQGELKFTGLTINLYPGNYNLTKDFKNAIDSLPLDYNQTAYLNFIDKYGTHFFNSGVYGGSFTVLLNTSASLLDHYTINKINEEMAIKFGNILKKLSIPIYQNVNLTKSLPPLDPNFNINPIYVSLQGGYLPYLLLGNWVKSIDKHLTLLVNDSQIKPITFLISNKQIRNNIKLTLENYT